MRGKADVERRKLLEFQNKAAAFGIREVLIMKEAVSTFWRRVRRAFFIRS